MLRPGAANDGRIRAFRPGCVSHSPPYELELQRLLADEPFQRRDPGFRLLKKIRRGRVFVKGAGLVLLNPDPDQVSTDIVTLGEPVQGLARRNS